MPPTKKEDKELIEETDEDVDWISQCDSCNCMTKTIDNKCGKCGENKNATHLKGGK